MNNKLLPLQHFINKLCQFGKHTIQCICDFDGTLTHFEGINGLSNTVIGQIKNSGVLGKDYEIECQKLFDFYNEIESRSSLSDYEKSVFMTGWRHQHIVLFNKYGLDATRLKYIAQYHKPIFRKGCLDFLQFLNDHDIPLTILSAAYANLIKYYLDCEGKLFSNTHLISNSSNATEIVINNFNKKDIDLHNYNLGDDLLFHRKNILVLGDTINDSYIANSINYQTIVKIGFVKDKNNEAKVQKMSNYYDIILYDDFDYGVLSAMMGYALR